MWYVTAKMNSWQTNLYKMFNSLLSHLKTILFHVLKYFLSFQSDNRNLVISERGGHTT